MATQTPADVEKLRAALQTLKPKPDQELLIEAAVINFLALAPMPPVVRPHPHFVSAPSKKLKELRDFGIQACALRDAYDAMHRDAIVALSYRLSRPHMQSILAEIALSAEKVRQTEQNPTTTTSIDEPAQKPTVGRPKGAKAELVANLCARYFWEVTGVEPGRRFDAMAENAKAGGPYHEFLAAIFLALGIEARSVEHYAKKSIKAFKAGME